MYIIVRRYIMSSKERPIGVFDSGVGGTSVLATLKKVMPNENYLYFGDSKNAPYGGKTKSEVRELTFKVGNFLLEKQIKALVIACNTATSAAVNELREMYDIPIIGIEPALKPATEVEEKRKIFVLATELTLREEKFQDLLSHYTDEPINLKPCPGLVELIETSNDNKDAVMNYLKDLFKGDMIVDKSILVLGCTHYPFVRMELKELYGDMVSLVDGNLGTAKETRRILTEKKLINTSHKAGIVEFIDSAGEKEEFYQEMYKKYLGIIDLDVN